MKTSGDNIIKEASKKYRKRDFTAVIRMLEPQVFRFRDSFYFYFLLGMSCLYTMDFGDALTYLQRGLQLKPNDVPSRLAIAVIHLKRQETSLALQNWLNVLDTDSANKYAKAGLKFLKRNTEVSEILALFDSGKYNRFLPSGSMVLPTSLKIIIPVIVIMASTYFFRDPLITLIQAQDWQRPETTTFSLEENMMIIAAKPMDAIYKLSETEVIKIYERARVYFDNYQDNMARQELNRLLYSNASSEIKAKAELIIKYLKTPKFGTLDSHILIEDVISEPQLYEGCFVAWRGLLANLEISDSRITFDLLVGYETGKILKKTVPVVLYFAEIIQDNTAYEVLAKIVLVEDDFILEGVALHILNL